MDVKPKPIDENDRLSRLPNELKNEILGYLRLPELHVLSLSSRLWHITASPRLYYIDATENNSSAIRWAVFNSIDTSAIDPHRRILRRSINFHGNVNVTYDDGTSWASMLHYAAASAHEDIVKLLLDGGADVYGTASNISWCARISCAVFHDESAYDETILSSSVHRCLALPALVPFLTGRKDIVKLLLKHTSAVGGILGVLDNRQPDGTVLVEPLQPGISILHCLAAKKKRINNMSEDGNDSDHDDDDFEYIHRFKEEVELPMLATGKTPLHISTKQPNIKAMAELVEAGADLEATNHMGRTPLLATIILLQDAACTEARKAYLAAIRFLLEHGANANTMTAAWPHPETPLKVTALGILGEHRTSSGKDLTSVYELLKSHGVDINLLDGNGYSVVHHVCRRTMAATSRVRHLNLLHALVADGGNVALPCAPHRRSVLRKLIVKYTGQPNSFLRYLLNHGVAVEDREVDDIFEVWIVTPRMRKIFDMDVSRLSQQTLDRAYDTAIKKHDRDIFDIIKGRAPTEPEGYVQTVFNSSPHKLWPLITQTAGINFNHVCSSSGRGFIHDVIYRLSSDEHYRESRAVEDVRTFMRAGTSVLLTDDHGKLAIAGLREHGDEARWPKLEYVLLEAMAIERGEF